MGKKKDKKKNGKKGAEKLKGKLKAVAVNDEVIVVGEPSPEAILGAADRVLADKNASPGAIEKAKKARKKALAAMKDKKPPTPTVFELPPLTGKETDEELRARVKAKKAARDKKSQVAEVVETEDGTVIAVGSKKPKKVKLDDPASAEGPETDPFIAPAAEVELNGNGQYKIWDLDKGDFRGFTRATTYIDCLEERSLLEKWKNRTVLAGVAVRENTPSETSIVSRAYHVVEHYAAELARIDKKDRKGKLKIGERADLEAAAKKEHDADLNSLADEAFVAGDGEVKANAGTDLHALVELYDRAILAGSKDPEKALPEDITPSDLADVRAYAAEMKRQGIEVVAAEGTVVLDDLHVAGRYDRLVRFLPEGATRRVLAIGDVKTGRIDYAMGKIGMQVLTYARGKGYDPAAPQERVDLKASRNVGLLIHLPQGAATCTIYELDLKLAAKGLALAGEVRVWRNEGKKVFDPKRPLTPPTERNVAPKEAEA